MKHTVIIGLILLICASAKAQGQYTVSPQRTWEHYPPEAQKRGFGLHRSQTAQMDGAGAPEVVLLFSAHNGHYPYFDLFKNYYVIIDHYTKEIKYTSDVVVSTEREIVLEDRNGDGRFELYRRYFKDGKFSTDKKGNNLSVTWVYDTIECRNTGTASTSANTATE